MQQFISITQWLCIFGITLLASKIYDTQLNQANERRLKTFFPVIPAQTYYVAFCVGWVATHPEVFTCTVDQSILEREQQNCIRRCKELKETQRRVREMTNLTAQTAQPEEQSMA